MDDDEKRNTWIKLGNPDDDNRLHAINNELLEREEEIKKRMLGDDEKAF